MITSRVALRGALVVGVWLLVSPLAAQTGDPRKNYDEYVRETSVPTVPAAALIGVEKSQIVEVASISKLSANLMAADKARDGGTPFGIDLSPGMLLADQGGRLAGMVLAKNYADDNLSRLLFRTRVSLAWATRDNSRLSAWGIHTRPFDLRDPFVDPELEACFATYAADYSAMFGRFPEITTRTLPAALAPFAAAAASAPAPEMTRKLAEARAAFTPPEAARLGETWAIHVRRSLADATPGASEDDLGRGVDAALKALDEDTKAARSTDDSAATKALVRIASRYNAIETRAKAASGLRQVEIAVLDKTYKACQVKATNNLWKRSYLALGYSHGSAKAVDAAKPLDGEPGRSVWITFVYGFEDPGLIWKGESAWLNLGKSPDPEKGAETLWQKLARNARLTLHASRHSGATKLVDGALTPVDGRVLGLGFDYADGDTRRWSAQVAHSRDEQGGQRKTERMAVLGLDWRLQDSVWFGLSWGRKSVQDAGHDKEVKAQLKWAFSENSWLKPKP